MAKETRYERCVKLARNPGYACENEVQVLRVARQLFAKLIVGGATIGKANGKFHIDRPAQPKPNLP